ncbi:hypothetical protein SAMN05428941_7677 [Streptomyces sp. 2114.2]|uniref:Uncharacterized protein n=1 Tax=Streptomyces violaceolatus TaxID=67378 RepID=A0ABN3SJB8_9ACTN|nr:hypothetical protein BX268_7690 [Streptomyces sp. 2221.1]SDT82045.1 hypothetical protein SAMN05428941_7677 [Streptomyces sp. 2114.2]
MLLWTARLGGPGGRSATRAASGPGLRSDTGFTVEKRPFRIRLDHARAGPSVNAYAQGFLAKLRSHATDALDADDPAAWDALLDETQPHAVAHRDDPRVHTTRTTWITRRP